MTEYDEEGIAIAMTTFENYLSDFIDENNLYEDGDWINILQDVFAVFSEIDKLAEEM